jgi:predicted dehydrogenase
MSRYRVGILGYGGFGQFLHQAWSELNNVQVVAVAGRSRRPDPPARFCENWETLIADPEIDILSIATPPSFHASNAIAAMESGKHVLIEKPLATSVEDAKRIITVQKQTNCAGAVNFIQRFNPLMEKLAVLTKQRTLGELRRVVVENYAQDGTLPPEHWFWNREISGGTLVEHAVHFIDLVNSLTDQKPIQVTGSRFCRNEIQEDQVMAHVLYDLGLMATHYHAFSRPGYFEYTSLRLVYDLAQVDLEGWIPMRGRLTALVNDETRKALDQLPGFVIHDVKPIHEIEDLSRMEGWGEPEVHIPPRFSNRARSSGIEYKVEERIHATFDVGVPKQMIYENCVRSVLQDLINKIERPDHILRTPLEVGLSSLEIACRADNFARIACRTTSFYDGERLKDAGSVEKPSVP